MSNKDLRVRTNELRAGPAAGYGVPEGEETPPLSPATFNTVGVSQDQLAKPPSEDTEAARQKVKDAYGSQTEGGESKDQGQPPVELTGQLGEFVSKAQGVQNPGQDERPPQQQ